MDGELNEIQQASREQFGRQSRRYGRGHILENTEDVAVALSQIDLPERAAVLDVATGAGHTGMYLAGLGHRVTFSDLTQEMLDRAREAAQARGIEASFQRHSAEDLPYGDAEFDLVTCRVAPHHFSSPGDFVAESARVLRRGGWLLVIDGTVQDGQAEAEQWMHRVEKLRDPSHNRLLTPATWNRLCDEAGLKAFSCEVTDRKQPDLEWYFETANTSPENRDAVIDLVKDAPKSACDLFRIGEESGRTVWWWQMLRLIARKN